MSELYDRISDLCKSKGITISAMCQAAGVSSGLLSDLKAGRRKTITLDTAFKIADALDTDVEYLSTGVRRDPREHELLWKCGPQSDPLPWPILDDATWLRSEELSTKIDNKTITNEEMQEYKEINQMVLARAQKLAEMLPEPEPVFLTREEKEKISKLLGIDNKDTPNE